ncbi:MAG: AAA family ATPase, partial [Lachnospiraceae bacterium]|nr:AAA family ATPase [Lachnospiraceae bacterium]
ILPCGQFVEVGRADLVGVAVGHTARIVKQKFREARGGVLFIDEAYSLCDAYESGYGDEAIDTIVQEMENHREDTVVIFAGYTGPMQSFLERNPGMMSRIAFRINFDDYSLDEMSEIAKLMVSKKSMTITDAALEKVRSNLTKIKKGAQRGNGRAVRQLLEEAEMNLSDRLIQLDPDTLTREMISTIDVEDIPDEVEEKTSEKEPMGFRLD